MMDMVTVHLSLNCNEASHLQVAALSSTKLSYLLREVKQEDMMKGLSGGINLRCHISTEGHHLQVLSVCSLQGRVLGQRRLSALTDTLNINHRVSSLETCQRSSNMSLSTSWRKKLMF